MTYFPYQVNIAAENFIVVSTFLEAGFSFLATFQSIGATIPEAAVPFLQHIALGNHHLDIVSQRRISLLL